MRLNDYYEKALNLHLLLKGKLAIVSKTPLETKDDIATAYAPGAAELCMLIAQDKENARRYSIKSNTVAVVSDGSSVPGLGNIGGLAAMPMMEGKALLFKKFGDVDAFPICLDTQNTDEIVTTIKSIAAAFGGINMENIAAPRCFEIERQLRALLDIPVYHDDRHGTAVVCGAAVLNAFRVLGKSPEAVRAVVCGAGAAGNAICKMLWKIGIRDIVVCDSKGILGATRFSEITEDKMELLEFTNKDGLTGGLTEAIRGRDLFIGASMSGIVTEKMIASMAANPIVFAMARPEPEINPDIALAAGARIIGTGCPDYPNYMDNALVFPGLFRGALDAGAAVITEEALMTAMYALAEIVPDSELTETNLLPDVFNEDVHKIIATSVFNTCKDRM